MPAREIAYFVRPCFITNFEETVTAVAKAGIHTMVLASRMGDISFLDSEQSERARTLLATAGIRTPASHGLLGTPYDLNNTNDALQPDMLQAHQTFMTQMAACGCTTYVCHPGPRVDGYTTEQLWDRVRKTLDALVPHAEALNLCIALENANPGHLGDNARELLDFVKAYDHPAIRLCFDSGHAHRAEDVIQVFTTMQELLVTVHLHDNDQSADQHFIPGNGTIPWDALIPLIQACPTLRHIETEAFNLEQWPHENVYARYCSLLKTTA